MTGLPIKLADIRRTLWQVLNPMSCSVVIDGICYFGVVAKGFCTDLTSAPRATRIFFALWQLINKPPIFHDWFYATHRLPRIIADRFFFRLMLDEGYGWRAYLQYFGVRFGGWYGYYFTSPAKMKKRTPKLFEEHFKGKEKQFCGIMYYN